jgi:hypothetical protein
MVPARRDESSAVEVTRTSLAADVLLLVHVGFVLFVVLGGALALRWPRAAWIHLPAAVWGAVVELAGWVCPLTPLEQRLRMAAGDRPPDGDFLERLLLPLLYPGWLTRELQVGMGLFVIAANAVVYWKVMAGWRAGRGDASEVGTGGADRR